MLFNSKPPYRNRVSLKTTFITSQAKIRKKQVIPLKSEQKNMPYSMKKQKLLRANYWDEIQIVNREYFCRVRKLNETVYIPKENGFLYSQGKKFRNSPVYKLHSIE